MMDGGVKGGELLLNNLCVILSAPLILGVYVLPSRLDDPQLIQTSVSPVRDYDLAR